MDCSRQNTTSFQNLDQLMTIVQHQIFLASTLRTSAFAKHSSLLPFLSQEMSLNIGIKRILPLKVSGRFSHRAQKIADFITELQRCEYWENVPLEFRRLSVNSIIISVASLGSDSCNPVLPSFVAFRMLKKELCRGTTQNLRIRNIRTRRASQRRNKPRTQRNQSRSRKKNRRETKVQRFRSVIETQWSR